MRGLLISFAMSLCVIACGGSAPQAQTPATASTGDAPVDNDTQICHTEVRTGSNIETRVCRSKSEDDANRDAAKKLIQHHN